ncbi:MAG: hypothetical protein J6L94_07085 [Acidaminococcaceae bacterium]|nr:hypothetical protein [Acidaminococcaceae bacterium]
MMKRLMIWLAALLLLMAGADVFAGEKLEAVYPYSLEKREIRTVTGRSTLPLFINLTSFDVPRRQQADVTVVLPEGFSALPKEGWQIEKGRASARWALDADYAQNFDLLYLQPEEKAVSGKREIIVTVKGNGWEETKRLSFAYDAAGETLEQATAKTKKPDRKNFNWYIQSVTLPVDPYGHRDDRAENGVVYIRDTTLEGFRNRIKGDGATNWSAVFNHPATFLLLDMRNPQRDIRVLKFKAQLLDRVTGRVVEGLATAGKTDHEAGEGWAGETGEGAETTALISLDGKKAQTFILPLYVDYFKVLEGEYTLRVTVSGGAQQKIQEVPLTIAKKHSLGLMAVGFAFVCFVLMLLLLFRLKKCVFEIGAKGAITVALFAAISFGGISLPSTILGDLVHALLGPFSGLVTGLLSGIMQYLLIVSLLVLYRKPGVLTLLYVLKFMLSGIMFGHFSPIGVLSTSVYIVVTECLLWLSGFYRKEKLEAKYMFFVAVLLGIGDALITLVNLEQMMFFYRLYYADWFLAMYMMVNGLLYSSIGSWIGYKTGIKLRQVVSE